MTINKIEVVILVHSHLGTDVFDKKSQCYKKAFFQDKLYG